jgi:signal transduction histidine kinase
MTESDLVRVQLHSVANVVAAALGGLQTISRHTGSNALAPSIAILDELRHEIWHANQARFSVQRLGELRARVASDVAEAIDASPTDQARTAATAMWNILRPVFPHYDQLLDEFAIAADYGNTFVWRSLTSVVSPLQASMELIRRNSRIPYDIAWGDGPMIPTTFRILVHTTGDDPRLGLAAPAFFSDAVRDLVANARKYSTPGFRIIARILQTERDLNLSVADQGVGIPAGDLRHLGEMHFRGEDVGVARPHGFGLGLSKVCLLARRHGGTLRVRTRVGVGSCFRLTLPRCPVVATRSHHQDHDSRMIHAVR